MIETFIFLLGLAFASFLIALAYRIDKEQGTKQILFTRSVCDNCEKTLKWYELIPVLSFIFLKGRCPKCKKSIPAIYTFSELFLGISFVLMYKAYGANIWYFVFLCFLFFLSYFDYKSKTIPQVFTNILLGLGGIYFLLNYSFDNLLSIGVALAIILFFAILNMFKKSFGFGDMILLLFFSFVFSPTFFATFLILCLYTSALWGIFLAVKSHQNIKSYIPLVPFMTLAFVATPLLEKYFVEYILPLW